MQLVATCASSDFRLKLQLYGQIQEDETFKLVNGDLICIPQSRIDPLLAQFKKLHVGPKRDKVARFFIAFFAACHQSLQRGDLPNVHAIYNYVKERRGESLDRSRLLSALAKISNSFQPLLKMPAELFLHILSFCTKRRAYFSLRSLCSISARALPAQVRLLAVKGPLSLPNLMSLQGLSLKGNVTFKLCCEIAQLTNLRELRLVSEQSCELHLVPLTTLTALRVLRLQNLTIPEGEMASVSKLRDLQELVLEARAPRLSYLRHILQYVAPHILTTLQVSALSERAILGYLINYQTSLVRLQLTVPEILPGADLQNLFKYLPHLSHFALRSK